MSLTVLWVVFGSKLNQNITCKHANSIVVKVYAKLKFHFEYERIQSSGWIELASETFTIGVNVNRKSRF